MLKDFTYTDVMLGYRIDIAPLDPHAQWPTWCWQVVKLSNHQVIAAGEYREKTMALQFALNAMNAHVRNSK